MSKKAIASTAAMSWPRLMSDRRLMSASPAEDDDGHRSPFETDGDRISFTAEWRRASAKTQVHEPDPAGGPVRTRGSHSNEVSRVARSIGQIVGHTVVQRHRLEGRVRAEDIAHAVAAAGLAHDLGNPPFGHAGEEVIADFFGGEGGSHLLTPLPERLRAEFANVDGNAQGFRIVTRLTGWRPVGGLQLTCATLASQMKYPFQAADGTRPWGRRKYGFYAAEADMFRSVAEEVGLIEKGPGQWCRHPLVHLLEGADDLCYLVVDTVDAATVGDLSYREAADLLAPLLPAIGPEFRQIDDPDRKLEYLQARAIGRLVRDCAEAFLDAEAAILTGDHPGNLIQASPVAEQVRLIAEVARRCIYKSEHRMKRQASGIAILRTLLEEISTALLEREHAGGGEVGLDAAGVLMQVYRPHEIRNMPLDRYGWLRGLVDTITSMTDARSLSLALSLRPEIFDTVGPDLGGRLPVPTPDEPMTCPGLTFSASA